MGDWKEIKQPKDFEKPKENVPPIVPPSKPSGLTRGLDVSHYQAAVDWKKAWDLGFRFSFAKAVDGVGNKSRMFDEHRAGARAAGLITGSYCFNRFNADPVKQAANFVKITGGILPGELPLVLDVEWDRYSEKYGTGKSMDAAAADHALTCLEAIEKLSGMTPIIYTNYYFFNSGAWPKPERFARFIPWIPAYHTTMEKVRVPKPWKELVIWQDSDDFVLGNIKAIDTNVYRGSVDQLRALTRKA